MYMLVVTTSAWRKGSLAEEVLFPAAANPRTNVIAEEVLRRLPFHLGIPSVVVDVVTDGYSGVFGPPTP